MFVPMIQIRNGELWIVKYGAPRRQMCHKDKTRPCGIDCVLFRDIERQDGEGINKYELVICEELFTSPVYEFRGDPTHDRSCACDAPTGGNQ